MEHGRTRRRLAGVGVGLLALCFAAAGSPDAAPTAAGILPSVAIVPASTPMTSTTRFTAAEATATCPPGTTLVGGGDELTRAGAPVTNDGAVTLGLLPSDAGGDPVGAGSTDPGSWTTVSGYSGEAPGTDTVTSFAMCSTAIASSTIVETATTGTASLGPVTAACPAGTSLIGGGGGYTAFPGNNTKVLDSYPSDAAGDLPANGATNPSAWTVKGNGPSATPTTTTAVALCSTGEQVSTEVIAVANDAVGVPGGGTVGATATCADGAILLDGGSHVTSSQNGQPGGPGNGGQGVHLIGDYPSDTSSWTVLAQDGGQNLDALDVEAFALCDTLTSGQQLAQLLALVSNGGAGQSLDAKAEVASRLFASGETADACNVLAALSNEARAQSGKQLAAAEADAVLGAVVRLRLGLDC